MKKLSFIIIILGFTSCQTLYYIPSESTYYNLDFRKYADKDFLITSDIYRGEYMTLGIVSYEFYPEANYITSGTPQWITSLLSVDSIVDSIYNFCNKMGANALVEFNIETIEKNYVNITNPTKLNGIKISGYAIKRIK